MTSSPAPTSLSPSMPSAPLVPHAKLLSAQPCPICLQQERRVVSTRGRDGSALTTVMCTGCALVHSHPMPTPAELDAFYAARYRAAYKGTLAPRLKHALRYASGALQRLARLKPLLPADARIVDVGSGSGEFIYVAARAGYQVTGVEPHAGYAAFVREKFSLDVINATISTAPLAPASVDAITLNHVLEHLPDPVGALTTLASWLKPDGVLFVEVPDIENDTHAPSRRYHYAHVYNFNAQTLAAVLRKAGFVIEPTNCRRPTSVIARKRLTPQPELALPDAQNFARLWPKVGLATDWQHHLSWQPYRRVLGKLIRYPAEWLQTRRFRSSEDILKQALGKAQQSN